MMDKNDKLKINKLKYGNEMKKIKNKNMHKNIDIIKKEFFSKKFNRPIDKNTLTYTTKEQDYTEPKNLCIECSIDMGINNPRQLCGKTTCLYS